jgi:uncharacterized protein YdcH (DUF465 family)
MSKAHNKVKGFFTRMLEKANKVNAEIDRKEEIRRLQKQKEIDFQKQLALERARNTHTVIIREKVVPTYIQRRPMSRRDPHEIFPVALGKEVKWDPWRII